MSLIDRQRRQSVYGNSATTAPSNGGTTTTTTVDYEFSIGQRVMVHGENPGTVRYVGTTSFQTGRWIGIELDEPKGKNAGVVQGKRYFECRTQHGVFVRPTQVKLLPPSSTNNNRRKSVAAINTNRRKSVSAVNTNRRKSVYNTSNGGSDDLQGGRSLASSLEQQQQQQQQKKQLHRSSAPQQQQMQQRTTPTTPTSRRMSTQPTSKASTPSPTLMNSPTAMKRRPTSLLNEDTPRASITLTASNRRKSMSVRQQQQQQQQQQPVTTPKTPTTRPRASTQSSIPQDKPPSIDTSAREKQLQLLKMKQLQQLQLKQQQQQQQEEEEQQQQLALSQQNNELDDDHDDTAEEGDDDDDDYNQTDSTDDTDSDQVETASTSNSDHMTEQDFSKSLDEHEAVTPSPVNQQQVYGALASTKPTSKSDQMVPLKDYEELRFKLKILEGKRQEDRERFREHEKIKEEAEQFLTLRNKLQDKIADLQKDVRETKRDLKDAMDDKESFEAKYIDVLESLEMMTLDKEVAEERAESLQLEISVLTDKIEEISVDLDILRKESEMMNHPPELTGYVDSKASLEVIQLERHNDRLKEALIRLRDAATEKEAELSDRVKELERDCFELGDIKEQCDRYKEKLNIAEYQLEDLKQQLDDALGAEDLVDQLTEKNLNLTEKLEEMRGTVDDLEALKELADELEENHVETEKQLEAEIDHRDMLLREQLERLRSSEETAADYESTIQQFRELVTLLQSDLEELRQKEESQASEKHNLSSQSQAMMSLNLQLQSTVMKAQAKSIDLELRKLDGAQATDRLGYIQPYLPDAFFKSENEPISCLLLFKRLVFKSDLIIKHLDQNHPISEKIVDDVTENLVTVCEMRQKAGWLGDLAKRFVSFIKHCKPDVFVKMAQVYHDLVGTERRLNAIVETFRTDDSSDVGCLHELQRIISQLEHLAEAYLGQHGESSNADQFFALTRALDFNADRMTVDFTYVQQLVIKANRTEDIQIEEGSVCLEVDYLEPLTRLIVQSKNSKIIAKKLLRQLEELSEEALTLKADHLHRFKTLYAISSKLCKFCYDLCYQITAYVDAKRGSKETISVKAIQKMVREKADETLDIPESTLWEASLKILKSLTSELANTLTGVENDHKKDKIASSVSPWIQRASDMKAEVMVNHDLERKLQQHNEEMVRLIKDVKLKDQSLQEASVKVDLLERRMEFAKKEAEQLSQLEDALEKAHSQEQMYVEAMDNLQAEYDVLEQENIQLKKEATKKEEKRQSLLKKINYDDVNSSTTTDITDEIPGGYQMMDSHMQTLKAAIRYLRSENAQLKSQDYVKTLNMDRLPKVITGYNIDRATVDGDDSNDDTSMNRTQRIQSMASQTRVLLKDMRMASACPKLVELSEPTSTSSSNTKWQSIKKTPSYQYQAQQSVLHTLQQRTRQLQHNIQAMTHENGESSISSKAVTSATKTSPSLRSLATIKIPLPQLSNLLDSTMNRQNHHHCIQLNSTKEFERIHSLFIH